MSSPHIPATASAQQHRFLLLDAVRGLAAVFVVLHHGNHLAWGLTIPESGLAVDLFFCLSGFVIALSYEQRLATRMSLPVFALARLVRLYPLYILGCVLAAGGVILHLLRHTGSNGAVASALELLTGLFMLPDLSTHRSSTVLFPLNTPAWSLFFEMVANLAYAALLRLRLARSSMLAAICVLSLGTLIGTRTLLHLNLMDAGWLVETFTSGFPRVGYSFFAGVLIFRFYRRRNLRPGAANLRGAAVATALLLAVGLCLGYPVPEGARPVYELIVAALVSPGLVLLGACCAVPLQWKGVCNALGDVSYPLYALHYTPSTFLIYLQFAHPLTPVPITLLTFALTALLFWISLWVGRHVDVPVRRWLGYRLLPASSAGVGVVVAPLNASP